MTILQRLPEDFKDVSSKLGELIQKKDAVKRLRVNREPLLRIAAVTLPDSLSGYCPVNPQS